MVRPEKMSRQPDYYAVVQVDPGAESEVIDAAYRRLAAKYHPDRDRSPGATERMAQINTAYEVLADPEKRRAYDRSRSDSSFDRPISAAQEMVKRRISGWLTTAGLTILMLMAAEGMSRFGSRMLVPVVLLVLLGLLLITRRKA
jgi:preprotein translocase subunit Sec63